jgi:hypothetical protein
MRNHRETATAIRGAVVDDPLPLVDSERERELRAFSSAIVKRKARTHHVGAVRRKLLASVDGHLMDAAAVVGGRETERISPEEFGAFKRSVGAAVHELEQEQLLGTLEHHVAVTSEPGPYFKGGSHSFYADLAASITPQMPDFLAARTGDDMRREAVDERLRRHAVDMRTALRKGTPWGQQIKASINERFREENEHEHRRRAQQELRVMTAGGGATATAGTSMSVFVSPAFLLDAWAPYRGIERTFADQCKSVACPAYGMQIYVPVFSTTDSVKKQTEEGTVTSASPTTELEGAKLETLTGMVVITQQLLDRALLAPTSMNWCSRSCASASTRKSISTR